MAALAIKKEKKKKRKKRLRDGNKSVEFHEAIIVNSKLIQTSFKHGRFGKLVGLPNLREALIKGFGGPF